jgi:hypothetical protein
MTIKYKINIFRQYLGYYMISVHWNHKQASPVSWDYPFKYIFQNIQPFLAEMKIIGLEKSKKFVIYAVKFILNYSKMGMKKIVFLCKCYNCKLILEWQNACLLLYIRSTILFDNFFWMSICFLNHKMALPDGHMACSCCHENQQVYRFKLCKSRCRCVYPSRIFR